MEGTPVETEVDDVLWDESTRRINEGEGAPALDYQQQHLETDCIPRGTQLGRYSVLEPIGEGGMGVVYKAWDPQLDRTVALKVLRNGRGRSSGRRALLAEAQTLAKIEHPNIVAIYDAGFTEERVFIAMALCEGQTLSHHLAQGEHSTREILDLFIACGRGLAAAHQTGVVHRDFKPANVLIGKDGSVRVADFGMARLVELAVDDEDTPSLDSTWEVSDHDQSVSTIVGTPTYMAPEQLQGRLGDHRMDQFSFCLCLYTALLGRAPFHGKTFVERRRIVPLGLGTPERELLNRSRKIPARARRALLRGLSVDPEQRFASMDDLLAQLEERRRWPWTLSVVALSVGVALGVIAGGDGPDEPCRDSSEVLGDVWTKQRSEQLGTAIQDTDHPEAKVHRTRVLSVFDDYARSWQQAYAAACQATYVDHVQSESMFDRRMQCLRRRRSRLDGAVGMLLEAKGHESLDRRVPVAYQLPAIEECNDTEALTRAIPLPEDEELRRDIVELEQRIDMVNTMRMAGSFEDGLVLARSVVDDADVLQYDPLRAQALEAMGRLQADASSPMGAEHSLREAIRLASRSRDVRLVARAWPSLIYAVANQGEVAGAKELQFAAEAAVEHADDALARAWLYNSLGILYSEKKEYEHARDYFQRALRLKSALLGPQAFDVGITWINLGFALAFDQHWRQARDAFDQAQAIFEHTVGSGHPHNDLARSGLCKLAVSTKRYEAALRLCRDSLARLEVSSASSSVINRVRVMTARALFKLGRVEEGLEFARKALSEVSGFDAVLARQLQEWIVEAESKQAETSSDDEGVADAPDTPDTADTPGLE